MTTDHATHAGAGAHGPLIDALWPAARMNRTLRAALLAVVGSLLMWASAKVQVPLWPVPITMQTFAVLLIGMAYGWRLGAATMALYLAEGAVGLPVFARGGGLAYLLGPTGGYLVAYPFVAALVGWLAERGWDRSLPRAGLAMLAGNVLIYGPGLAWLTVYLVAVEGTAFAAAMPKVFTAGLVPFILGDLLKLVLAAAVLRSILHLMAVRRGA